MTEPLSYGRGRVIDAMKADAGVVAFVPADAIFPSKTPNTVSKPFIRVSGLEGSPIRATGMAGDVVTGTVHIFVAQSETILDPETFTSDACGAVKTCLEALDDCYVERVMVIPDGAEPDDLHGMVFWRLDAVDDQLV